MPRKRELLDSDEDDEGQGPGRALVGTALPSEDLCYSPYPLHSDVFFVSSVVSIAAALGTPVIHKKKRFQIEDDDED